MNDAIITVENLSKKYRIQFMYTAVREAKNARLLARISDTNGVAVFTSLDSDAPCSRRFSRAAAVLVALHHSTLSSAAWAVRSLDWSS